MTGLKDYIIVCSIRLTPADSSFKRFRRQSARIPPGVSFDSLIFHGAPDLIINANAIREGIVTTGLDDDDDNEKMAEGTKEEDLPSSQGSSRIQIAH